MDPTERRNSTEKRRANKWRMKFRRAGGGGRSNGEEDTMDSPEYITDDDMRPTSPGVVAVPGRNHTREASAGAGKSRDGGKLRLAPPVHSSVADTDASLATRTRTSIARKQLGLASASYDEERGLNMQINDLPDSEAYEKEKEDNDVLEPAAVALEATLVEDAGILEHDREKLREEIVTEFLRDAVIGEAAPLEETKRNGSRRNSYVVAALALLLLVVIGVVVAVVVAKRAPPDQDKPSKEPTETPEVNVASAEPSMQPTSAPTISIANLNNSRIEEAHPLVLGADPYLVDSSIAQTMQGFSIDCGPLLRVESFGLWYTYRAKRSGPVTMVSCGGSADVYGISTPSYALSCLFDTMYHGDVDNCDGDSVSWMADAGVQYQVFLNTTSAYSIKIVDHSQCEYAFGPVAATSTGSVFAYTITAPSTDATAVYNNAIACGDASQANGPGVWYTIEGTGKAITASTCNQNTNFDTQISVFRGSCDGLVCVNGNNDSCGQQSKVIWGSMENETYYIFVHGKDGASGDFELVLSGDADRRGNDFCETAIEVTATESFEFTYASEDQETRYCEVGTPDEEYPIGIWYTVTGDGSRIEIDVGWSSLTPVRVQIFTGECGTLECLNLEMVESCVGGGAASRCNTYYYIESSVEGMIYYILLSTVESFDMDTGGQLEVVRSSN